MKEKFIKFLKSKRIYTRYIENLRNHQKTNKDNEFFERIEYQNWIYSAFNWAEDDLNFWSGIMEDWKELYKQ